MMEEPTENKRRRDTVKKSGLILQLNAWNMPSIKHQIPLMHSRFSTYCIQDDMGPALDVASGREIVRQTDVAKNNNSE